MVYILLCFFHPYYISHSPKLFFHTVSQNTLTGKVCEACSKIHGCSTCRAHGYVSLQHSSHTHPQCLFSSNTGAILQGGRVGRVPSNMGGELLPNPYERTIQEQLRVREISLFFVIPFPASKSSNFNNIFF